MCTCSRGVKTEQIRKKSRVPRLQEGKLWAGQELAEDCNASEAAAAFGRLNKGIQLGVAKTGAKAKGMPATGKTAKGTPATKKAAKGQPKNGTLSDSGFRGVTKTPNNRWVVRFKHKGKPINGGTHATAEEAAHAQDKLRRELGYTEPGFFTRRESKKRASAQSPSNDVSEDCGCE
jgi:hypothetical protein